MMLARNRNEDAFWPGCYAGGWRDTTLSPTGHYWGPFRPYRCYRPFLFASLIPDPELQRHLRRERRALIPD